MAAFGLLMIVLVIVLAGWLYNDTFNAAYLTEAATALASPWGGYTLHLYQNNVSYAFGTTLGGLTECNFAGYAAVALSAGSLGALSSQTQPINIPAATFTRSTTGTTQTAYGYYILDSGSALIGGGTFGAPGPYAFTNAGDSLTLTPQELVTAV